MWDGSKQSIQDIAIGTSLQSIFATAAFIVKSCLPRGRLKHILASVLNSAWQAGFQLYYNYPSFGIFAALQLCPCKSQHHILHITCHSPSTSLLPYSVYPRILTAHCTWGVWRSQTRNPSLGAATTTRHSPQRLAALYQRVVWGRSQRLLSVLYPGWGFLGTYLSEYSDFQVSWLYGTMPGLR